MCGGLDVECAGLMNGFGRLPGTGMGIDRVAKVMNAFVGVWVRPDGGFEESESQMVWPGVKAVLAASEDAGAEARVGLGEVCPTECGDFPLGLFSRCCGFSGAGNSAKGDLVGCCA